MQIVRFFNPTTNWRLGRNETEIEIDMEVGIGTVIETDTVTETETGGTDAGVDQEVETDMETGIVTESEADHGQGTDTVTNQAVSVRSTLSLAYNEQLDSQKCARCKQYSLYLNLWILM